MRKQVACLLATFAVSSSAAYAHSELVGSIPADKATVASAPKQVMLQFSEGVKLTGLTVQKEGQSKQSVGPLPAEENEHFMVAVPSSGEGQYTITWRALSDDGHIVSGEFSYLVGAAGAQPGEHGDHAQMHKDHSGAEHGDDVDHAH